jgi:transcriptional regulator with XRE-family HTH domain
MNRLARWMVESGTTRAGLAARIGVTAAFVSRLASDDPKQRRGPGLRVALAIEHATAGAVPASSWDDEPELAPSRPLRPRHA